MKEKPLPAPFAELMEFVPEWALATEAERFHQRLSSEMATLKRFYDALLPRMDAICAYLQECPLQNLSEEARTLLDLALSFIEISRVFEVWGKKDVRADFFPPEQVQIRSLYDRSD